MISILKKLLYRISSYSIKGCSEPPAPEAQQASRLECLRQTAQDALLLAELNEARAKYIYFHMARMEERLRDLIHHVGVPPNEIELNNAAFDYKWTNINIGRNSLQSEEHKSKVTHLLTTYTGKDSAWFEGKRVLDAGCGDGRFSYALLQLGCEVVSVDITEEAVHKTLVYCQDVAKGNHTASQANLLSSLDHLGKFEMVLAFGVIHHSGDTLLAMRNISSVLHPEGLFCFMVYGYPAWTEKGHFDYQAQKDTLHFSNRGKNMKQVHDSLAEQFDELSLRGWFDAIAPIIEDYYFDGQVFEMLINSGFYNIECKKLVLPNLLFTANKNGPRSSL